MAAKSKEQKLFEQHAKMLADMLKLPGNEICADCGSKGMATLITRVPSSSRRRSRSLSRGRIA